jgi:predicted NBD/HSP70 family sugar kinase
MPKTEYYISVDVGGTNCRIGLLEVVGDAKPKILQAKRLPIGKEYESGLEELVAEIKELRKTQKLAVITASFAGIVDTEKGKIFQADHLTNWAGKPLRSELENTLHSPVLLQHDVAAAAIGEAFYGKGANLTKSVFLIMGTGFGGAKIEKLKEGVHISSFEAGHQQLERNSDLCVCGQHGCAEIWLGGGQLVRKANKPLNQISDNDPIWEKVTEMAAQAFLNIQMLHPTPLIAVGGGLMLNRPFLLEKIKKLVAQEQRVFLPLDLQLTSLGDNAALFGGLAMQKHQLI